jgi:hypothetical protein
MDSWIHLLQFTLGLLKKPWKLMVAVLILSVAALYSTYAQSDPWLTAHRTVEWALLIFSLIYLSLSCLEYCAWRVLLWRHFQSLPGDERRVIVAFMHWNRRTANLISNAGAAMALTKMGVLETVSIPNPHNIKVQRGDSFFTIKSWAFKYFRNHPHLLQSEDIGPPPTGASWPQYKRWLELRESNAANSKPGLG